MHLTAQEDCTIYFGDVRKVQVYNGDIQNDAVELNLLTWTDVHDISLYRQKD